MLLISGKQNDVCLKNIVQNLDSGMKIMQSRCLHLNKVAALQPIYQTHCISGLADLIWEGRMEM